jgi:hypothetical protein
MLSRARLVKPREDNLSGSEFVSLYNSAYRRIDPSVRREQRVGQPIGNSGVTPVHVTMFAAVPTK